MPSPPYHRRAIEEALATRTSHRVTVLEGRRAVGKSSLARHRTDSGPYASYQSLTEPAMAERAQEDAFRWVSLLRRPAVIDEAQMVPGVSVAIKELVDTLPLGHHFLLTGSASVGRGTMAGSGPLVGRMTRLVLHPFTALEMDGPLDSPTPSLIDILFDSPLAPARTSPTRTTALRRRLETGGLPALALPLLPRSRAAWQNQVRADTLAILGNRVLPTETLDTGIARRVLDSVLRTPGGRINRTRIGQDLDLDARTVGRYLGILQRRFLITLLPNLHGGVTRAGRSAPKGHAVDTSSTCESLIRAGHSIAGSPELLGQTLETWVVNQVLAARGWAATATDAFYWRDNKTGREVDLVLIDGRGRRLGIEVKLASRIGPSDLRGLRAMREHGGLHRGFIAYTGADAEEIDDGVWALPLECLTSREALGRLDPDAVSSESSSARTIPVPTDSPTTETIMSTAPSATPNPSVFLSYVHADDEYHGGALVQFARAVEQACDYKGTPIDLIIDRDVLQWGDDWSTKLQEQVERTTFLLAMVTNRYLTSEACREEFLQFRAKTETAGYNGLLTLLVDEPNWDRPNLRDDPTAQLIHRTINQYQWLEAETPFEDLEPGSRRLTRAARKIADELVRRIDARNAETAESSETSPEDSSADPGEAGREPDLIELVETIHTEHMPRLEHETDAFDRALSAFGSAMRKGLALVPQGSAPSATQIKRIAEELEPSRRALDSATSSFSEAWRALDEDISALVRTTSAAGIDELAKDLKARLTDLAASLKLPGTDDMTAQTRAFAALSRSLRPAAETMTRTLGVMDAVKRSAGTWAEEL